MNFSIEVFGLKINYTRESSDTPNQRVLLIHGTGCDGRVFEDLSSRLSLKHDVVVIDLPGHGRSEGDGFRGVADYAAYCAALISSLGWKDCIVAGHSLGGGVAIAMSIYDSHLIKGLILIDTGARLRVNPEVIKTAKLEAGGKLKNKGTPRVGFSSKTPSEIVERVRDITRQANPVVTFKDWIADDTCDFMSRMGQIEFPTLAICGREDELTPLKYHQYLTEQMPNCTLEIIEDAGHWSFVERPREFFDALSSFLDNFTGA